MSIQPVSAYACPDPRAPQKMIASLVTSDGKVHKVHYRLSDDGQVRFDKKLPDHLEEEDEKLQEVLRTATRVGTAEHGARLARIDARRYSKRSSSRSLLRISHAIRVIGGGLLAPARLVGQCAIVALSGLAVLGIKGSRFLSSKKTRSLESSFPSRGERFFAQAVRDVRVALLQLIPEVGKLFASQYRMAEDYHEFVGNPALEEVFSGFQMTPAQCIYGLRSTGADLIHGALREERDLVNRESPYLNASCPTMEDAVSQVVEHQQQEGPILVRIPSGEGRYHDGTMYLAPGATKENATVVLYHGNAESRQHCIERAESYYDRGYNVLLSSYAGDLTVHGTGKAHSYAPTACTELAMREDAQADVSFLKRLGVTHVAVEGYSLGGSQAMNFAQAVGGERSLTVDSVVLDRTFTTAAEAAKTAVHNKIPSNFLSRVVHDWMKRSILQETKDGKKHGCDGLDNREKLRWVASRENFRETKFFIIGATEDQFLADLRGPEESRHHAALDLTSTLLEEGRGVACRLFEGDHQTLSEEIFEARNAFLFQ